jgi:DNA polymerase-3 subunit delta
LNVHDLIASIGQDAPAPVYLFCPGKSNPRARQATYEPFLAEHAVELITKRYVEEGTKDLAYAAFYADETPSGAVVQEAQTLPFLTERRVVLVRNADRYASEAAGKALLSYLENPAETTVLMLVAGKADKRTKFFKACAKAGEIVECPQLSVSEAVGWASRDMEARGKSADRAAVREIIQRAGTHLSDINNAVRTVCDFVGQEQKVTEADVVASCSDVAEEEVWGLTDAIAESQPGEALARLRKLLDLGKHADELMGTINWLLTSAYQVAVAEDAPPKVSPFVAKKVAPLARKLGVEKLRAAFQLCTDTHYMLRSTGVDSALAMELLVVKLAAPRRRPAAR